MPTAIGRDELRRLLAEGALLVDVLPAREFHEQHLPGAISLPLKTLNAATTAGWRKEQPVIVYCYDYQ
jgi:rhodanese-related sulfurtransferase